MLTAQADQPGILSGSVAHPFLSTRSASPSLNGLHGSRAVLLADRLHRSPIQVMAHRILPGAGNLTHLVRQDSRGLGQERPQGCRMRHVPLPRGNGHIWSVDWALVFAA